ncbi:MAG: hypothetical protein AB2A00_01940 [Myxococcota bacterium]
MWLAVGMIGMVLGAQVETPRDDARALVWTFEVQDGVDSALAPLLTDALVVALRRSGEFSMVHSSADVQDILQRTPAERLGQCTACLASVQRLLAVSHVVVGRITRVGGQLAVSVKLVDTEGARVMASVLQLVPDPNEAALLRLMDVLASRLLMTLAQQDLQDAVAEATAP